MWPNPQETVDLVTFTEEILNEKLHFFVQCIDENYEMVKWVNCVLLEWNLEAYSEPCPRFKMDRFA